MKNSDHIQMKYTSLKINQQHTAGGKHGRSKFDPWLLVHYLSA